VKVVELGHVVLYVRDLDVSTRFYRDLIGFDQVQPDTPRPQGPVAFSSGRTHHELLLIEVDPAAAPIPAGTRVGMDHFALKVGEGDEVLRKAKAEVEAMGVTIIEMTDHTTHHSIYFNDPDGNEVELYVDIPEVDWRSQPSLALSRRRELSL
jgi:catechol-2,3-dioxygenase